MFRLFIAFIALIAFSFSATSQVSKGRAILFKTQNNINESDSSTKISDVLFVLDEDQKTLKSYQPEKTFDIVSVEMDQPYARDTSLNIKMFRMIDDNGRKCLVTIYLGKKLLHYISIVYQDFTYTYFIAP